MNDERFKWPEKTVLIAEDEMINFMLLQKVLQATESKVLWAKNGLEAVRIALEIKPDLILMDLRMPEMNGILATQTIRETNADVPIVAVTAFTLDNETDQCMQAGCTGFLAKPVRPTILYELMDKIFAK